MQNVLFCEQEWKACVKGGQELVKKEIAKQEIAQKEVCEPVGLLQDRSHPHRV